MIDYILPNEAYDYFYQRTYDHILKVRRNLSSINRS